MVLSLLGLGLGSSRYLTLGLIEELEKCDEVYLDTYTGFISEELKTRLRRMLGERLTVAGRRELEEGLTEIVKAAEHRAVGVIAQGDPLIATTHISLAVEASRRGIPCKVIHGVSIYSAAPSAAGLQAYKFGRTVTLTARGDARETYRVVQENLERGLHTLILLDTYREGVPFGEAMKRLLEAEESMGRGVIREEGLAVALAGIGLDHQSVKVGTLRELAETDLPPPQAVILPGELHFMEAEALIRIHGAREELVRGHKYSRSEKERTLRYILATRKVLDTLEKTEKDKETERVINLARSYLEDASAYWSSGEIYNALATVAYAEGLLDGLRMMGKVDFQWPKDVR